MCSFNAILYRYTSRYWRYLWVGFTSSEFKMFMRRTMLAHN